MKRISALTLTLCLCAGLFAPAQTAGADPLPDGSRSAVLDQGTAPARIAYASTQTVEVDGEPVVFETYALRDANGSETNYIKLRDLAGVLNGTHAQFQVNWFGYVSLSTGTPYTPNGTEMHTPYTGDLDWTAGRGICIDTQVRYLQALQVDREEVLRLVNAARAEELRVQFSHTRPNGEGCGTVYEEFGITPNRSGENIASGYSNPAEVTEGWLNSPGHRMNIMIPNIQYLGVGRVGNSWVQLFLGL